VCAVIERKKTKQKAKVEQTMFTSWVRKKSSKKKKTGMELIASATRTCFCREQDFVVELILNHGHGKIDVLRRRHLKALLLLIHPQKLCPGKRMKEPRSSREMTSEGQEKFEKKSKLED
jgi:hypothetical protein